MTKEAVGRELITWLHRDQNYCRVLVLFALQNSIINKEEYDLAQADLNRIYKDLDSDVNKFKRKALMYWVKDLGLQPAKVLYQLFESFPDNFVGDYKDGYMVAKDAPIIKALDLPTLTYYDIINNLVDLDWIEKQKNPHHMLYKLNFSKLQVVINLMKETENSVYQIVDSDASD